MNWDSWVDIVFNKHPGVRIGLPQLIMMTLAAYGKASVYNYHILHGEVAGSIRARVGKDISLKTGRDGGLMLGCHLPPGSCLCGFSRSICLVHRMDSLLPCAEEPREDSTVCGGSLMPEVVVDDYTCGCGNTKCNSKEKSCWKCGTPISTKD